MDCRTWQGRWIAPDNLPHNDKEAPAPALERGFELGAAPEKARLFLASGGYHEVYINGCRPDDRVLAPAPSQFDKHVHYVVYEVAPLLRAGQNVVEILLGNGWYDCGTVTVWHSEHASWRDTVKLCCDLEIDGRVVLCSDRHWQWKSTPIVFNELRNGETFDARLEQGDPPRRAVAVTAPPGGIPVRESAPPCRITRRYEAVNIRKLSSFDTVYDFGVNLSGVCELEVTGPRGAVVVIDYAENVRDNGDIDREEFLHFVQSGAFQQDRYILKGEGVERYRARFAYHGFRYARIHIDRPEVAVRRVRAAFIHTDFRTVGSVNAAEPTLQALQKMTCQSYLSNFVGIPTDCPHREKNGWTADAMLALECGLWNFDCAAACGDYLRTVADTQRLSGQLSGIAPTGGFGYNGWAGPAWDSVIFEMPRQLRRFTGNATAVERYYDVMTRYLDFCRAMEDEKHLLDFGLGDWSHPEYFRMAPVRLTSSAFYCRDLTQMASFAALTGRDGAPYRERAEAVRAALAAEFPPERYDEIGLTGRAALLYFGIVPENLRPQQAADLAAEVRRHGHRADFGVLGAKWVPRVLSDYGYINDALAVYIQPSYPGWGYWAARGETTLCECWNRTNSHNHIFFGDVSAWMYEYLGGVSPLDSAPGFRRFRYAPQIPDRLDEFEMSYDSVCGVIRSSWRREADGRIALALEVPEGAEAEIRLPGVSESRTAGKHRFTVG